MENLDDLLKKDEIVLAFPSSTSHLDDKVSSHFGHVAQFTLIHIVPSTKQIKSVIIIDNVPHEKGGCKEPVKLLKKHGVDVLIVNGIGKKPYNYSIEINIPVYIAGERTIREAAIDLLEKKLEIMKKPFCNH